MVRNAVEKKSHSDKRKGKSPQKRSFSTAEVIYSNAKRSAPVDEGSARSKLILSKFTCHYLLTTLSL